ncbi:HD domain-containing protein [Bremerella sp. JC817]|uniref:HD domain-containing protein n=1 Tax=Bremerella sp. JC817 TaxID=3231756 RepID=UPI003459C66B
MNLDKFAAESLCYDPVHGYVPFVSEGTSVDELTERDIIDHPWLQRMRQIHQLQTAWWVYPTAEHTRFQHILGVMHLASRLVNQLYPSLKETCPDAPSRGYVESLMRMAGLLHDVGHGPFGHFFDSHFLQHYGLTHESLGAHIIRTELGEMLSQLRRNPFSQMEENERIEPEQIAWMIQRPQAGDATDRPKWLVFLRSLLSGIYTVDNMDFVLRDAYMTGYSQQSYDLERLLRYSFFTEKGLTIHERGMAALIRFMNVRAELFQTVYFHREVMAIDKTLEDLFADSRPWMFPGNPMEHLADYQGFTEFSLLVDAARWHKSENPQQAEVGKRWQQLLSRNIPWRFVCERSLRFDEGESQEMTIFRSESFALAALRDVLPAELKETPVKIALNRTVFRPNTRGPSDHQNFLYDSAQKKIKELTTDRLFRSLPVSRLVCRIYAQDASLAPQLAAALDRLVGNHAVDDLTNM